MTLKQFNADVAAAKDSSFEGVDEISRGESDGEFVFTLNHAALGHPVKIQALTPSILSFTLLLVAEIDADLLADPELYPRRSTFMLFRATEPKDHDLDSTLERLAANCNRRNVADIIRILSSRLIGLLDNRFLPATEEDSPSEESQEESDDSDSVSWEDLKVDGVSDDGLFEPNLGTVQKVSRGLLRRDLHAVKSAGIHVRFLKTNLEQTVEAISLSIRASKLGIANDILESWGIHASEYLVLLVQYPEHYPSMGEFLGTSSKKTNLRLRFGKCSFPKPSTESSRWAFVDDTDKPEKKAKKGSGKTETNGLEKTFRPLPMSTVIDSLLSTQLADLVYLRRTHKISWDEAQALAFQRSRQPGRQPTEVESVANNKGESRETEKEYIVTKSTPKPLCHDFAAQDEEAFNTILVCMQFALRRFAKCTEYCMVCHQKTLGGFEAIKPYVCSDPLCLYQYLSLGMGTSLEYEILHNPVVVDLLISLFYASLVHQQIRQFPRGLGMKVCLPGSLAAPRHHLKAEACLGQGILKFNENHEKSKNLLREGTTFLLVVTCLVDENAPLLTNNGSRFCQVTSIDNDKFGFQITQLDAEGPEIQLGGNYEALLSSVMDFPTVKTQGWVDVMVFLQEHELDDLGDDERQKALTHATDRIPSVMRMKIYLSSKPGLYLKDMNGLDRNSLILLRWIVASNTSLLVQESQVPNSANTIAETLTVGQKVVGLGDEWMQFRFAQGSPEKEQRFTTALQLKKDQNSVPQGFPTIFAWHGSFIGNWHSIIRSGLDFNTIANGRAYGNGVYFSNQMTTSLNYTEFGRRNSTLLSTNTRWQNSLLKVKSAISICEILNCPRDFISASPFYVVDKTEWIQCRYLFVKMDNSSQPLACSQPHVDAAQEPNDGYLVLDPMTQLLGDTNKPVEIPSSALPAGRRLDFRIRFKNGKDAGCARKRELGSETDPIYITDDEDEGSDNIDLELGSDNSEEYLPSKAQPKDRKRQWEDLVDSTTFSGPASKMRITTQSTKPVPTRSSQVARNVTNFVPGALDLELLPKLPEPGWAAVMAPNALRMMNKEVKQLQTLQAVSELATLGWYIHFEKLNNIFHWIVELHSFDLDLPLAQDMQRLGVSSIVLELRFGSSFPYSPPFVRVIRPRFKPFAEGGGGHVTAGGAICSELLTNSGWSPALSMDKVFLDVRVRICDLDPPARLAKSQGDYGIVEAADAYRRAVRNHGWQMPPNLDEIVKATWN